MADAGQDFGAVAFNRHPAPPAVPALTPAQLRVERIHVEIEARGHAIEGNHEGLSVRFAGAEKSQH